MAILVNLHCSYLARTTYDLQSSKMPISGNFTCKTTSGTLETSAATFRLIHSIEIERPQYLLYVSYNLCICV